MRRLAILLALCASPAIAQVSNPPKSATSFSGTVCNNCAMTGTSTINGSQLASTTDVANVFIVKYSKLNQSSNSTGVATLTIPANTFVTAPTFQVTCKTAGPYGWYVTTTGTPTTVITATVTFWKLAASITALGGAVTATISSPITFDIIGSEQR